MQKSHHRVTESAAASDVDVVIVGGNDGADDRDGRDPDIALTALGGLTGADLQIEPVDHARLLRTIDMHMMPIMCLVYCLNFLDKTTLNYAAVMGISRPASQGGLGLHGDQYNWLASIFYFGYLAWEWPTARLLQYFPLGKYIAFNIIAWGIILCCFAATTNFSGALALRFFLGLFEASVTPGFALLTSQWYTKDEQSTRTGIWFSFNGIAQIIGGSVSYGIITETAKSGSTIEPWKIIFLAAGLLTVVVGIVFLLVVPDNQTNARWLKRADRLRAIERVRANHQGIGNRHWKRYQFVEALTDPLSWTFVLYSLLAMIPNGGMTNFFSPIIRSFGYSDAEALLYGAPGGAVQVFSLVLSGYLGGRLKNRLLVSSVGLLIAILGMSLIVALPDHVKAGRLAGFYLNQAAICPFVALLSLISSNVAGYTKKTTVAAMYLIAYCVGNIIGPQTLRGGSWAPAEYTFIGCYAGCFLDILLIVWLCKSGNTEKEAVRNEPGYERVRNREFLDLTDRENPDFVYSF